MHSTFECAQIFLSFFREYITVYFRSPFTMPELTLNNAISLAIQQQPLPDNTLPDLESSQISSHGLKTAVDRVKNDLGSAPLEIVQQISHLAQLVLSTLKQQEQTQYDQAMTELHKSRLRYWLRSAHAHTLAWIAGSNVRHDPRYAKELFGPKISPKVLPTMKSLRDSRAIARKFTMRINQLIDVPLRDSNPEFDDLLKYLATLDTQIKDLETLIDQQTANTPSGDDLDTWSGGLLGKSHSSYIADATRESKSELYEVQNDYERTKKNIESVRNPIRQCLGIIAFS